MDALQRYIDSAHAALHELDLAAVLGLAEALQGAWEADRQVLLCGNGGSAANAVHLANDLLHGVAKTAGRGLRVHALTANEAIVTCLANDVSYEAVFSRQLETLARKGDLLVVLSGSGNSGNVVEALRAARRLELHSFAILGFSGGHCLALADHAIHLPVDDMQLSEDVQLMVGHMVVRWLQAHLPIQATPVAPSAAAEHLLEVPWQRN